MSFTPAVAQVVPVDTSRAERKVLALSGATIGLYILTWLLELAISRNGHGVATSIIDPASAASGSLAVGEMALYVLVTALLFLGYWQLIRLCRHGELDYGPARAWALGVPILLNLIMLAWAPRLSQDTLSYLAHGFLAQAPGGNPLLEPVQAARTGPYGPELIAYGWFTFPGISPYGILWTQLEVAIANLCGGHILSGVLLFKVIAMLASLGSGWLIWFAVGRISPALRLEATLAYLWNPLVLMELAGEGHNDALMIFFSLAAFATCLLGRPAASLICQLLGVLTKYINVLFVPAQLMYLWRTRRSASRLASQLAIAFVLTIVILFVLYRPLWGGAHSFDGLAKHAHPIGSATFLGGTRWVMKHSPLRASADQTAVASVMVLLFAIVAWTSLRVRVAADLARACAWTALAFALVATPDYWPWYACMPIAWICVGDLRRLWPLALLMSLLGRLVAPLQVLSLHGLLESHLAKGIMTGAGSLLPLLAWGYWMSRRSAALDLILDKNIPDALD